MLIYLTNFGVLSIKVIELPGLLVVLSLDSRDAVAVMSIQANSLLLSPNSRRSVRRWPIP